MPCLIVTYSAHRSDPPWPPMGQLLGFLRFFLNRRRGLANLLKLYRVFILTKKLRDALQGQIFFLFAYKC